jgi:uncharacterized Zn-binding protein involved in type VI secretion
MFHPMGTMMVPIAHAPQPFPMVTGCQSVTIGGQPAARVGDPTVNCMLAGCAPSLPGKVTLGSTSVTIGGQPAARVGDPVNFPGCVGPIPSPTGKIIGPGCPTVTIG